MLAGSALPAMAATFIVDFTGLNGSGVGGSALLDYDEDANSITVTFDVTGLEPNQVHVAHIHGRFNNGGQPQNSFVPTLADDDDGDGFIELGEGVDRYGPIIVPLGDIGADATGMSNYSFTFNLDDDSAFADDFSADDLFPLQLREIVIHGLTVPAGIGAGTPGEVDGTGGYLTVLPVAAGEIRPFNQMGAVPEPSTWAMMLLGFFGVGGLMRRRGTVGATKVNFAM